MSAFKRRQFLKTGALATAGAWAAPQVFSDLVADPPSRKVNVALVGTGVGRPQVAIADSRDENIVALCDVSADMMVKGIRAAQEKLQTTALENARQFKDFRKMLDVMGKEIDAVVVTTPDHTHFPIAMAAMQAGKHVMVEKPLTHTLWEARELRKAAAQYKVITQMGNQGRTTEGIRRIWEWTRGGVLGEVREVWAWGMPFSTNGKWFKKPDSLPVPEEPIPEGFDWDLWLGPAAMRPHNGIYYPKVWRGWWDFGSAKLGDWGAHTMEGPWWALDLGAPLSVTPELDCEPNPVHVSANNAVITYEFPARGDMPPVTLKWYETKNPPRAPELTEEEQEKYKHGGMCMRGSKAVLMTGGRPDNARIVPEAKMQELKTSLPPRSLPRVKGGPHKEFFAAIKGEGPLPGSQFAHAGPLTEFLLLGVIALRTGKRVEWDAENLRITNDESLNAYVRTEPREGWDYKVKRGFLDWLLGR